MDKTNQSYYGETKLHYLTTDRAFEGAVPLSKFLLNSLRLFLNIWSLTYFIHNFQKRMGQCMMFSGLPQVLNLLLSMDVSLNSSDVNRNISD